jgi:hypothetical protein
MKIDLLGGEVKLLEPSSEAIILSPLFLDLIVLDLEVISYIADLTLAVLLL